MKQMKMFGRIFLLNMVLFLLTVGCNEHKEESIDTQILVVERQSAQLSNCGESGSYCYYADFAIDVPLYGPQASVTIILSICSCLLHNERAIFMANYNILVFHQIVPKNHKLH